MLPVYRLEKNHGLLPLWNFGTWNHIIPAYWVEDEEGEVVTWGVFPLFRFDDLNRGGTSGATPEPGASTRYGRNIKARLNRRMHTLLIVTGGWACAGCTGW